MCSPSLAGLEEPGGAGDNRSCPGSDFKNSDPEFWRRIVKDSSLATNSLGRKKCPGKIPRIPGMEPVPNSGRVKQRVFVGFLS